MNKAIIALYAAGILFFLLYVLPIIAAPVIKVVSTLKGLGF